MISAPASSRPPPRQLLQRAWRGLWYPAQTLDADHLRHRLTRAANVQHGRTRVIGVLGMDAGCGRTTLTALLGVASYALHNASPAMLAEPVSAMDSLGLARCVPTHLTAPQHYGPDIAAAIHACTRETAVPLILVDTPPLRMHQFTADLFNLLDIMVLIDSPDPASKQMNTNFRRWLAKTRPGTGPTDLIDVVVHTTPGRDHAGKQQLTMPYDQALRLAPIQPERLSTTTLDATLEILATINQPAPGAGAQPTG